MITNNPEVPTVRVGFIKPGFLWYLCFNITSINTSMSVNQIIFFTALTDVLGVKA